MGWDLLLGGGSEEAEKFPHPGKPPSWRGRLVGTEGNHLGLLEGSETACLWQAGQSETYRDGLCHSPVPPSLGLVSVSVHGPWVLEHRQWREKLRRGLLLAISRQDSLKG